MPALLDLLRKEHGDMAALLRALEWQVAEFEKGCHPDYDVIGAALDYFQSFPDAHHHPKEDLLFARLKERTPAIAEAIGDLETAHRDLAAHAQKFAGALHAVLEEAELPREAFVHLARAFIELQRQHIDREEAAFFPAAERSLTAADWADLDALSALKADPRLGAEAGEKLEQLRKTILRWQAQDQSVSALP